jgi:WD40 repeat protein
MSYDGHTNEVNTVAWSPDGRYIASGSSDQTVQVWDARTGSLLVTYKGHSDVVTSLAWSPDGRYIASASWDHTVQVWQAT